MGWDSETISETWMVFVFWSAWPFQPWNNWPSALRPLRCRLERPEWTSRRNKCRNRNRRKYYLESSSFRQENCNKPQQKVGIQKAETVLANNNEVNGPFLRALLSRENTKWTVGWEKNQDVWLGSTLLSQWTCVRSIEQEKNREIRLSTRETDCVTEILTPFPFRNTTIDNQI